MRKSFRESMFSVWEEMVISESLFAGERVLSLSIE